MQSPSTAQAPQVNAVCEPQMRPLVAQSAVVTQLPAVHEPLLQTWLLP